MLIRCGGRGGWLRAREALGGRHGPQGGGYRIGEGPQAAAHWARRLGPMGKSRGRNVRVDIGAPARGAPMAPGCDGESWYDMARSSLMFGDACGELSSPARHREVARSRGTLGAQAHARRRWGMMAVGEGTWKRWAAW
jgi:hypothetical protein